jgi:hypothetical protein
MSGGSRGAYIDLVAHTAAITEAIAAITANES